MPIVDLIRHVKVHRSARVLQLEGLFEIPPSQQSELRWRAELPLDAKPWSIGLIVGPSGSGKSTLANELFPKQLVRGFAWPASKSIVDAFPESMGIKDITGLLSSVGFSSPPSWLRPFAVLSNGEQFRVTMARALAEAKELVVIDEFTSVVDRTVARIGSAAIAKSVRRNKKRFVAVSCHYDIVEWLQPDWVFDPSTGEFTWRRLRRRPQVRLEIARVSTEAWALFKHHHYMSADIHRSAKCFVALCEGRPAAFAAVLSFPHPLRPAWRGHRTVCLPDFQGIGIGNVLSEFVGSLFRATGKPYFSATGNPAMIRHRARSPLWRMTSAPKRPGRHTDPALRKTGARNRFVAGFEFVGAPRVEDARRLGVLS